MKRVTGIGGIFSGAAPFMANYRVGDLDGLSRALIVAPAPIRAS